jgi:hypothetical protein
MKLVLTILFCMVSVTVFANPFLVSDKQAGATSYQITGAPDWLPKPVVSDGSMRIDLGTYYEGTWNIKVKACNDIWCGPEADYTLTCPAPLTAPVLKIEP